MEELREERDKELVREYLKSKRSEQLQNLVEEIKKVKDDKEYLMNEYDFETLGRVINELRKEGEDVTILKEVWNEKIDQELEEEDSSDLSFFDATFNYTLFGSKGLNKKSKSKDSFDDYELYNYEEEELEDDDYYNDDLD